MGILAARGCGTVRGGIAPAMQRGEADALELRLALRAACRGNPEPEPPVPRTATELAMTLLHAIAEDPGLRGSHRIAARRHFRQLERLAAEEQRGPAT